MRYRFCRLISPCLLLAVLVALPGCKLPTAFSMLSIGKSSKADDEKAASAAAPESPYPGVQASYQAPASRAVPQACGAG
jgi:hypothetical protein